MIDRLNTKGLYADILSTVKDLLSSVRDQRRDVLKSRPSWRLMLTSHMCDDTLSRQTKTKRRYAKWATKRLFRMVVC